MMHTKRHVRLNKFLELLENHAPGYKAPQLAGLLGVCEKTVYRDYGELFRNNRRLVLDDSYFRLKKGE